MNVVPLEELLDKSSGKLFATRITVIVRNKEQAEQLVERCESAFNQELPEARKLAESLTEAAILQVEPYKGREQRDVMFTKLNPEQLTQIVEDLARANLANRVDRLKASGLA